MSKLLVDLFMLQTKALVNVYTWSTLPLYAVAQRPWQRLKKSKSFDVQRTVDSTGRTIYSRPCTLKLDHPFFGMHSLNQMVPLLDPKKKKIGVRKVISEQVQTDSSGQPIKVDGKVLKRIQLAPEYTFFTVGEVMQRVDAIARGLQQMGVGKGEKVALLGDNSLEWFATALALQRINAVTVTLLSILNEEGILYGLSQTETRFLVTTQELLPRIDAIAAKLKHLRTIVYIADALKPNDPLTGSTISSIQASQTGIQVTTLDKVEAVGAQMEPISFPIPHPDSIQLIMFTSGTTGVPKGCVLQYHSLMETVLNLTRIQTEMGLRILNSDTSCYLPMAHIFGYLMNLGVFVTPDATLSLCSPMTMLNSSPSHIPGQAGDFSLSKPVFLPSVPLVLDRILKEIYRKLQAQSPIAEPLFTYLMEYKIRWTSRGFDTPIINRLVCKKINDQFGGRLTTMMVGSAPLNERTQSMVKAALNINLLNAYGCTEGSAGSTTMMAHDLSYGSVGVPCHSVKFYLKPWDEGGYSPDDKPNPRGEIVLGGPPVAKGYYKMPEETAESFKTDPDGTRWFETGDIGEVLPNGALKIIDRKKDLTKLANGEFVSLGKIEAGLRTCQFVESVCICTSPYSNFVTALVSPNRKALAGLAERLAKLNLSLEQLCTDADVKKHVLQEIQDTSKRLGFANKEIPQDLTLVAEEWTVESGLLTAAMKMKRKQVNDFYRDQIKLMFAQKQQ